MRQRVTYLLKTYLLTVLLFMGAKVAFMLYYKGVQAFTVADVAAVVWHGLSLDLSMSLYLLIVPFLCAAVSIWVGGVRLLRYILSGYYAVAALALALAFVADTSLYEFWLFKLDATCLQYLDTPAEAMASVSLGYVLLRLVVIAVLAVLFYLAYSRPRQRVARSTHRVAETLAALLLIPFMVIGIRGGLGESTTNIGQVYFSQNQFLNHSAVNPVFSFLASFEKSASINMTYHFMEDEMCDRIVGELYNTQSVDTDTLLTTRTPNIILILMEGCGGEFTEIGGRTDVTPHLNRLAKEGVYFTNCYGNTWRTDRGTVCTWSGYPSFPTMSVMKIPAKSRTMPNIAKTLSWERHYETRYLYGGDINFTNMRSYLIAGGFQQLTWKADYSVGEQKTAQWGVRDDITFETLYDMATTARQPFLVGFSTLSSHQPWDVPIRHFDDKVLNAFYYLDQCIGRFVEKLRQSPVWENTLVVLLPDHGIPYNGLDETAQLLNHIPVIWTGGAVKEARRIGQVCNQTDLAATLLGQLGLSHADYAFSRDVLSKTYTQPFAIHTFDDGFSITDSSNFVCYDFISNKVIAASGLDSERLVRRGKAVLQAASKDLNER